jgi:predicted dehydrogenase
VISIAFIGAGGIARRHVEAIGALDDARIVAIADALAAQYGATAYSSTEAFLQNVDLVYILTPPSTHRELAVKASV